MTHESNDMNHILVEVNSKNGKTIEPQRRPSRISKLSCNLWTLGISYVWLRICT